VTPGTSLEPLTDEVLEAMAHTIQDEYRAEAIYLGVLQDHGNVFPFFNIVRAEVRHSEAIAHLYQNRELKVPTSRWSVNNVPRFRTLLEACRAGVEAERENIALYDEYSGVDLPRDVSNVFTSNRLASLDRHLPAFELCAQGQ
jgi:hypothetical protein